MSTVTSSELVQAKVLPHLINMMGTWNRCYDILPKIQSLDLIIKKLGTLTDKPPLKWLHVWRSIIENLRTPQIRDMAKPEGNEQEDPLNVETSRDGKAGV